MESKLQIKIGSIEFSGEGNQEWLSGELDKVLGKVPELLKTSLAQPSKNGHEHHHVNGHESTKATVPQKMGTLATWLKDKSATTNQTRRFLATAAFIQLGGKDRVATGDVASLLKNSNQARLGNPSDALNKNVGKGYCEKDGSAFYITPEGFKELSIEA